MELILIRHGLPERREDTADPPLSDHGHEQARRVAAWLADEAIDAVYASTMLRARQTADRGLLPRRRDQRLDGARPEDAAAAVLRAGLHLDPPVHVRPLRPAQRRQPERAGAPEANGPERNGVGFRSVGVSSIALS